jgi:hypothetical protein
MHAFLVASTSLLVSLALQMLLSLEAVTLKASATNIVSAFLHTEDEDQRQGMVIVGWQHVS